MAISDIVNRLLFAGFFGTAGITGAVAVTTLTPATAQAKPLEELTPINFAKRVYENPNPVIVLFYQADRDKDGDQHALEVGWRMERVVEALADKYPQIDFLKVAIDHTDKGRYFSSRQEWINFFGIPDTSPQTAMYARHDVLTGQQYAQNTKIDVLKGGPLGDKWIPNWIQELSEYWIKTNIFRQPHPEGNTLVRYNNGHELQEVGQIK